MSDKKQPDYRVFVTHQNGEGKTHYRDVGAGWKVANGGISIKLDATPIDGRCVIFPRRDDEKK